MLELRTVRKSTGRILKRSQKVTAGFVTCRVRLVRVRYMFHSYWSTFVKLNESESQTNSPHITKKKLFYYTCGMLFWVNLGAKTCHICHCFVSCWSFGYRLTVSWLFCLIFSHHVWVWQALAMRMSSLFFFNVQIQQLHKPGSFWTLQTSPIITFTSLNFTDATKIFPKLIKKIKLPWLRQQVFNFICHCVTTKKKQELTHQPRKPSIETQ